VRLQLHFLVLLHNSLVLILLRFRFKWHRHSCLCAFFAARSNKFAIKPAVALRLPAR
jgi:hypothetical protein